VATGKSATKHGVAWFMVDRPDGTRVPVPSYNRKTKAIWNILAEHRRRPAVLGWWATYPAEDVGKGLVVSDGLGFHGFGSTARDGEARLREDRDQEMHVVRRAIRGLTGRSTCCNFVITGGVMVKTLQKHGNSQALVIDKALMEALGIEGDTPLQVTVSGNSLIVTPVSVGVGKQEITEALEKLRPRYGEMLQRLAE